MTTMRSSKRRSWKRMSEPNETPVSEGDIEDTTIDVESLVAELEAARDEAASHLDDLKRVAADFDNFRKRSAKENETTLGRAVEQVVQRLMPALDSFDAALGSPPQGEPEQQMYSGMLNTREVLLKALEAEGLEVIPTVGEMFDPEIHEPTGAPGGSGQLVVTDELRRGYRLGGKVLRAALVVVDIEE